MERFFLCPCLLINGDEELQQKFNNRALGSQKFANFWHAESCDKKLSGGTSANHAKHLHPLTHVNPLPPHTHARSPRQMKDPVRILSR